MQNVEYCEILFIISSLFLVSCSEMNIDMLFLAQNTRWKNNCEIYSKNAYLELTPFQSCSSDFVSSVLKSSGFVCLLDPPLFSADLFLFHVRDSRIAG
jgi:hypothetical protein